MIRTAMPINYHNKKHIVKYFGKFV